MEGVLELVVMPAVPVIEPKGNLCLEPFHSNHVRVFGVYYFISSRRLGNPMI